MLKTKYKTIPLDEIVIPQEFARSKPKPSALIRKTANFCLNRDGLSCIVVDKDNVLSDGYMSYLILKELGFSAAKCKVVWEVLTRKERKKIAWETICEAVKGEQENEQNGNG